MAKKRTRKSENNIVVEPFSEDIDEELDDEANLDDDDTIANIDVDEDNDDSDDDDDDIAQM